MKTKLPLDNFTLAYIESALWSSTDDKDIPLDSNYSIADFAPEALEKMTDDCRRFQAENDLEGYPDANAGHDFWLTRCGHGCGFGENDFGTEDQCARLTRACKNYGEVWLTVGDDGLIYC